MALPRSLDPSRLLNIAVPGDLTVGEVLKSTENSEAFKVIRAASSRPSACRVRFLLEEGKLAAEEMTMVEFRRLVRQGKAHISIDDGSGGELV